MYNNKGYILKCLNDDFLFKKSSNVSNAQK